MLRQVQHREGGGGGHLGEEGRQELRLVLENPLDIARALVEAVILAVMVLLRIKLWKTHQIVLDANPGVHSVIS